MQGQLAALQHSSVAIPVSWRKVVTDDRVALGMQVFEPRVARATVIVNGATAVPQHFYRHFAQWLARRGYRTVTYDYRGVGASRPRSLRGFYASMTDWALGDARAIYRLVKSEHPGPLVLVGHSFGGQLVGLLDELGKADAAVMVAAQLGYYGHWSGLSRLKLAGFWHLAPALSGAVGYLPGWAGLGVDLPRGVANQWARWCRSPGYLVSEYPEARERFARFDVPTLFYSFSDDDFAPEPSVTALIELFGDRIEHRRLRPSDVHARQIGHFGFFKAEHETTLWEPTLAFIERALAPS